MIILFTNMPSSFGYLFPRKQIELTEELYLNILLVWDLRQFSTPLFTVKLPPGIFSAQVVVQDLQQILKDQNEIAIHQSILQVLMTEVQEIINDIALPIMNFPFQFRCNTYNIKFSGNFQRKEESRQIWYRNSDASSTRFPGQICTH